MSLIHRLIVGHFDIETFKSSRPVPLRPLDDRRTRAMLDEVGRPSGDGEYSIDGETLYYTDGYCDCPWLSHKHNEKSERFAHQLAGVEDCYLIEEGGAGTIHHPNRSLQFLPWLPPFEPRDWPVPPSRAAAEIFLRGDDPDVLCRVVLDVVDVEETWVEGFCAGLSEHGDFHVRGNAVFALGRLATKQVPLDRKAIQPIIERAIADPNPYVSGQAVIAAEAVERSLRWVVDSFDNGNPELDVSTYANGWIRCPNCGWRFATYDPWAFREGRCMECRQRLRVISGDA